MLPVLAVVVLARGHGFPAKQPGAAQDAARPSDIPPSREAEGVRVPPSAWLLPGEPAAPSRPTREPICHGGRR
ncbi:hypothetical protein OTC26_016960 [Streptomyces tirandamycinicus]|uniref:hypothetical protein n=1 Tax=Streptomyces tirandamycinicus TaxID=2174846 RepID=UPI002270E414|nr:hypothetical protein [Streptomyces tirandamycinicus]MCY0982795.1 hypothetical protein [Streptomyces tirandamycinicus]